MYDVFIYQPPMPAMMRDSKSGMPGSVDDGAEGELEEEEEEEEEVVE